ncbi:hypothetical protein T492DRAFT_847792 [Pavlovales sp. CCMP2436]|nr:hypothetical protein T492DRAFT_847792 [Pavlovales sp. CCMP2436]
MFTHPSLRSAVSVPSNSLFSFFFLGEQHAGLAALTEFAAERTAVGGGGEGEYGGGGGGEPGLLGSGVYDALYGGHVGGNEDGGGAWDVVPAPQQQQQQQQPTRSQPPPQLQSQPPAGGVSMEAMLDAARVHAEAAGGALLPRPALPPADDFENSRSNYNAELREAVSEFQHGGSFGRSAAAADDIPARRSRQPNAEAAAQAGQAQAARRADEAIASNANAQRRSHHASHHASASELHPPPLDAWADGDNAYSDDGHGVGRETRMRQTSLEKLMAAPSPTPRLDPRPNFGPQVTTMNFGPQRVVDSADLQEWESEDAAARAREAAITSRLEELAQLLDQPKAKGAAERGYSGRERQQRAIELKRLQRLAKEERIALEDERKKLRAARIQRRLRLKYDRGRLVHADGSSAAELDGGRAPSAPPHPPSGEGGSAPTLPRIRRPNGRPNVTANDHLAAVARDPQPPSAAPPRGPLGGGRGVAASYGARSYAGAGAAESLGARSRVPSAPASARAAGRFRPPVPSGGGDVLAARGVTGDGASAAAKRRERGMARQREARASAFSARTDGPGDVLAVEDAAPMLTQSELAEWQTALNASDDPAGVRPPAGYAVRRAAVGADAGTSGYWLVRVEFSVEERELRRKVEEATRRARDRRKLEDSKVAKAAEAEVAKAAEMEAAALTKAEEKKRAEKERARRDVDRARIAEAKAKRAEATSDADAEAAPTADEARAAKPKR